MNAVGVLLAAVAVCPAAAPVPDGLGVAAVGRVAATEAMQLNTEGKQLYRQDRWAEAREKYRAALAADPELLAARLNIACSFSRQQRYAEAADEAAGLIRAAFVPWNREVHEAADLGILQDQKVNATIEAASAQAARSWGAEALRGIPFVARTKPPLRLTGEGVLVLGGNQEVFAWIPETGRFLQLTAEDGRVLAVAASRNGQRIAYVLGGKVVRTAGQADRLRGLALRVLDLPTMTLGKPVALPGDLTKVQLAFAAHPTVRLFGDAATAVFEVVDVVKDGVAMLQATSSSMPAGFVELTALGVRPGTRQVAKPCPMRLFGRRDEKNAWRIHVVAHGKNSELDTRYGAGLDGLPFIGAGNQ